MDGCFPRAQPKPRRTGRANADVATGRGELSLPRAIALRGLRTRAFPAGVTVRRATELVERIIINGKYPTMIGTLLLKWKSSAPNLAFSRSSPDTSRLLQEERHR